MRAKGKGKSRIGKRTRKVKATLLLMVACLVIVIVTVAAKGNQREIVGYTYDTGNTVWDIAKEYCPDDMDIRDFVKEIEKANEIENHIVYENWMYKVPIYEMESDYLDMTTIVGYETSDDGVLLLTNDGNGYYIEK